MITILKQIRLSGATTQHQVNDIHQVPRIQTQLWICQLMARTNDKTAHSFNFLVCALEKNRQFFAETLLAGNLNLPFRLYKEKTGKTALGVSRESVYMPYKSLKHSCFPSQHNPLGPASISPHRSHHLPFPQQCFHTLEPDLKRFFGTTQLVFPAPLRVTTAQATSTHRASGLVYLQLGHILLVVDLQGLPLVLLLLQLVVVVRQLFHQTGVL